MDLNQGVEQIKGVGPKTAAILEKAGLHTVRDLLYYLPRGYENYQSATTISRATPGKIIIKGKISQLVTRYGKRRNFTITEGVASDGTGSIRVVWFNQPYRAKAFKPGQDYYLSGEYDFKYGRYQLTSPAVVAASEVERQQGNYQPIYPAKGKLNSAAFKKLFATIKPTIATIPDMLPSEYAPDFITGFSRADALLNIHFPESNADVTRAHQYLSYEELFELLLAAKLNKQENQQLQATPLPFVAQKTQDFVGSLPFKLTNAQRKAAWDILQDLVRPTPMNRLLQGDVGSGKTVVAAMAAHQAAISGHQTAILAPTAILATQHAESLSRLLKPQNITVALLTGATKHKDTLKKQIKNGEVDIIVGTHALLTDDTQFHSLALCIIDEQHRFGVHQRQKLLAKTELSTPGKSPHFLAMTATPIPRSLQLTIFGDLDVSIIGELPKGRQPIQTSIVNEVNLQSSLYPRLHQHLQAKEQIYWICRAIDDNPTSETASVKKQARHLQEIFKTYTVDFLHGRMKPDEKDQIMAKFAAGKTDILVSTTVVEVGVDVPNATQIIIQDAENYGLAQLHQLRGRVGRGTKASHCYLLITGDNPPTRRLKELERSTNGFYLAEVDLKLRGPGEIYGNLQHGALDLRIASLADTKLIAAARAQALAFAKTPENMVKYPELAQSIRKYQQLTTLN